MKIVALPQTAEAAFQRRDPPEYRAGHLARQKAILHVIETQTPYQPLIDKWKVT